ncbi:MAG: hypothetical protein EU535_03720 [Promethearchaeota archaeon]|nr:MAG: hypothetical protein EU535_03720 [Candidatus Lokiarchaeota archaeon]
MELEKLIDQRVTLHGSAKNAKGGAVIITKDNNVIYVKNLESWSPKLEDKQMIVSGLLKKEKFIPDPIIDENGAISCGAKGMQFVLENAEYYINV